MDASFELEVHRTYLHIKHPPGFVISPETTGSIWPEIAKLCQQHGVTKLLIEAFKPERKLDTMATFDAGRAVAEITSGLTIAICLHDYEFDDLSTFFKTVVQNRGVKLEFFSNIDDALQWLDVDTGENAAGTR